MEFTVSAHEWLLSLFVRPPADVWDRVNGSLTNHLTENEIRQRCLAIVDDVYGKPSDTTSPLCYSQTMQDELDELEQLEQMVRTWEEEAPSEPLPDTRVP